MRKAISKDGTVIAYDRSGEGATVILVGGALSQRETPQVTDIVTRLALRFTVIDYDRRGRGESGDAASYAVRREVEDIEALIDEAGGMAFVYGHSSGAVLALEAARILKAKIKKLALYEPPIMTGGDGAHPMGEHVAQLKQLLAVGRRGEMVEYFMTNVTGMPAEAVAPMKGSAMWPGLLSMAPTLVYDLTLISEYDDPTRRISGLTTPILAMDGGASPEWAARAAQRLVDTFPNAERRTLAGQTHAVDPAVLAPVLVKFFEA